MKISNKLFLLIISTSISICLVGAIVVRLSISKFEYDDISKLSDNMVYCPYTDIEFSSGSFKDVNTIQDTSTLYKYIVKGKATGHKEVLEGAILTEVEVIDVLQGNITSKSIYIYEPVLITPELPMLTTFEGYNFIKDKKEYIFCLCDLNKDYYNVYTKGKKNIYMYTTPFFGKFPLKYSSEDFTVVNEKDFTTKPFKFYSDFRKYEQIFSSEEKKNKYFEEYNRLLKLSK